MGKLIVDVLVVGSLIATTLLAWITPYRYTTLKGLPVRVHRITGRTEILYPFLEGDHEAFRWVTSRN